MSILLGKLSIKLSRMMGHRGTDVGGRTALKFNKKLFRKLASDIENIIIVTGTNGKSTLTNIIANTLERVDGSTISNKEGANMYTGLLSCMIENYHYFKDHKIKYAVFEVDEGNVPKVLAELDSYHLVITNFFRDQLDRYSEIDILIDKVKSGIDKEKGVLVLNADDPFCMRFEQFEHLSYGLSNNIDIFNQDTLSDSKYCPVCGKELIYTHNFYSQLGHYHCSCGFKREDPKYTLEEIEQLSLIINGTRYNHNLLGMYNSYNVLAAIAMLKELNISDEDIKKGLETYHSEDGRMQKFEFDNKRTYLNLVKNPAGMNMSLQEVKHLKPEHICFIVNDAVGDGIDVSWLWDADFELLLNSSVKKYYVCGTRAYDVALRLKNMGIDKSDIIISPLFAAIVDNVISENALVCVSYTGLNQTKKILLEREG